MCRFRTKIWCEKSPLHPPVPLCMVRASPASKGWSLGEAPVAQLDRAPDYESGGWRFESFRARHFPEYEIFASAFAEGFVRLQKKL